MKNFRYRNILGIFFLGVFLFSAAGCQLYQPGLDDLKIGTAVDVKTKEVTTPADFFAPSTEAIFASVLVRNASSETKLRATWTWAGHSLGEPTEIEASGTRFAAFNIQRPREGWRSGNYSVTVEILGTEQKLDASFTVE